MIFRNLFSRKEERAQAEDGLVDTAGEEGRGTNGESGINIHRLLGVRWTASEKLLCSIGEPSLKLCDDLEGGKVGEEERKWKECLCNYG